MVREKYKPDSVNNPEHYTAGGIECIEAIQSALTPEEFRGFLKGNVMKYIWRERMKGGLESCKKAGWYQKKLVEFTEQTNIQNHKNRAVIWGDEFPRSEMPAQTHSLNVKAQLQPLTPRDIDAMKSLWHDDVRDAYDRTDGMYHHLKLQGEG